jgi:uncharacterized protein DUF6011
MSKSMYRCVYRTNSREITDRLFDVGINDDGTLHNPKGYPDDVVRAAVQAADARRHERRSKAAKVAAVTRRKRQAHQVYWAAKRTLDRHPLGPRKHCAICSRSLDDPASIERGIGSECWESVLTAITAMRRERMTAEAEKLATPT